MITLMYVFEDVTLLILPAPSGHSSVIRQHNINDLLRTKDGVFDELCYNRVDDDLDDVCFTFDTVTSLMVLAPSGP